MASPLSESLARTLGRALAPTFLPAALNRDTPGNGPAWDPGEPTTAIYPCKAIVEKYAHTLRDGTLIQQNDRKVLILANSLGVRPQPNDRVTIQGITFTVIDVATDPATAVWECQGRM